MAQPFMVFAGPGNLSEDFADKTPLPDDATSAAHLAKITRPKCRAQAMRDALQFSQGVAMILGENGLGKSQSGNNKACCQDNDLSWIDWPCAHTLIDPTAQMIALRQKMGLSRRRFATGRDDSDGVV